MLLFGSASHSRVVFMVLHEPSCHGTPWLVRTARLLSLELPTLLLYVHPHEGYASVSVQDRVVVATVPCRSWGTLRADCTTLRRGALSVVASSSLVSGVHTTKV